MVQTIKDLGIEYVAANPGSSFEGLQESFINYGNPPNQMPEFITALHEESAVTMAHGYAKAEGKPMLALLHGTIGIQHAAMSIYQAYYDRVPVLDARRQRPGLHCRAYRPRYGRDGSELHEVGRPAEDSRRGAAWRFSAPTTKPSRRRWDRRWWCWDSEIQKDNAPNAKVPAYKPPQFVTIDATRAREIAKGLVEAQNPRIAVGRLRTPEGVKRSVELAELVGASTSTAATGGPMSFPAAASSLRPGRGHDLRLHAGS